MVPSRGRRSKHAFGAGFLSLWEQHVLLPGHRHFRKCRQDFSSMDDITKFSMPMFADQCGCAGKRGVAVQWMKRCPSQGSCARAIPGADTRRDALFSAP